MKIAVAGTGYVGLSLATLLSQKNEVVALDVIPEKVEMVNNKICPIKDIHPPTKKAKIQFLIHGDFLTHFSAYFLFVSHFTSILFISHIVYTLFVDLSRTSVSAGKVFSKAHNLSNISKELTNTLVGSA